MKKLIVAVLIAAMSLTLAACDNVPDEVVDQVQFCIDNPDDPSCEVEVDCTLNPDDPSCEPVEVDCTVNPDDPSCEQEVDCTVNPDDPACEQQVDCTVNPDDPSCPLTCDTGYELNEDEDACVLIDTRTPAEIAADLIISNWDGTMEHVGMMMTTLNFNEGMTMETEYVMDMTDGDYNMQVSMLQRDTVASNGMYPVVKREVVQTVMDETIEFTLIFETTETGFVVYYDTSFLRSILADQDVNGEVQAVLDTLDANGTWFMFRFDDSLSNLVEVEVLQEMLEIAFVNEFGTDWVTFFTQEIDYFQMDLDNVLQVTLSEYGLDFSQAFNDIATGNVVAAETMFNNADYNQLYLDLDQIHLVPEIVSYLYNEELGLQAIDPLFSAADEEVFLLANGTEAWVNQLTEAEVEMFIEYELGTDVLDALNAAQAGEFEEYVLQTVINDPDVQYELSMIPDFDEVAFTATINNLDYDALVLEYVNPSELANAIYEGQVAFDAFVVNLQTTAPIHAELLAYLSPVVLELEQYMVFVDDFNYAVANVTMFAPYFDLDNLVNYNLLENMIEADVDQNIVTSMSFHAGNTSGLVQDFVFDLYGFLDGFESFEMPYVDEINCPEGETCESLDDFLAALEDIQSLGDIVVNATYSPLDADRMVYSVDASDFMQSLMEFDTYSNMVVNEMSMTMRYIEGADVTVPTEDVTDLNAVAYEFAKFSLIIEAYEYLNDISYYYGMYPDQLITDAASNPDLNAYGPFVGVSDVFDRELSYVVVGYDMLNPTELDFAIQLYWLDGTAVFTDPVGLDELMTVMDYGAPTRADYEMYVGKVDDANFNMTKLFLMFMMENNEEVITAIPQ